jgi:hypothetical protein
MVEPRLLKAQAKYFKNSVSVFLPTIPRLSSEERLITNTASSTNIDIAESNLERSLRRTRSNIKDITLCNDFDLFVTLTIGADRYNLERSKQKVKSWIKNECHRKGKFDYLIVPELHKDRTALHFHGLFKGYKGKLITAINPHNGIPIKNHGRPSYNFKSFTLGNNSTQKIDNSVGSIARVGFYLMKYITKDMPVLFGQNRYWASHGLIRPTIQDNPEPWYKLATPDHVYENDFGTTLVFEHGKNVLVDMYIEANRPC